MKMNPHSFIKLSKTLSLLLCVAALGLAGCSSPKTPPPAANVNTSGTGALQPDPLVLREGDAIRVEFPGAPNLNVRETIKRDGKISMLVGEVEAAGKTVAQLQKELLDLYSPQLVTKLVVVSVESSNFPVYFTGAVAKSGKVMFDRPVTALQGVLEAGVDLGRANLKGVRLSRTIGTKTEIIMLDLDKALRGKDPNASTFYLMPSDIIYVPEKFQWF